MSKTPQPGKNNTLGMEIERPQSPLEDSCGTRSNSVIISGLRERIDQSPKFPHDGSTDNIARKVEQTLQGRLLVQVFWDDGPDFRDGDLGKRGKNKSLAASKR